MCATTVEELLADATRPSQRIRAACDARKARPVAAMPQGVAAAGGAAAVAAPAGWSVDDEDAQMPGDTYVVSGQKRTLDGEACGCVPAAHGTQPTVLESGPTSFDGPRHTAYAGCWV